MTELKECPNCNKKLNGLMLTKTIVSERTKNFINYFHDTKANDYCTGCAPDLIAKYTNIVKEEKSTLNKELLSLLTAIPIVTVHTPAKWDYDILGIISAQSVTGTGLLSELSSSWSDFVGGQSNSLTTKLNEGESICRSQLRYKAVLRGGNAVIGTDIDYAEVGGAKAMMMVCMAGTAVKVNNIDSLYPDQQNTLDKIAAIVERINTLNNI